MKRQPKNEGHPLNNLTPEDWARLDPAAINIHVGPCRRPPMLTVVDGDDNTHLRIAKLRAALDRIMNWPVDAHGNAVAVAIKIHASHALDEDGLAAERAAKP